MRQSRVLLEDAKLEEDRHLNSRGTVRIRLDALYIPTEQADKLDKKNVQRLKEIFRREGCRPQEVQNHIVALIDQPCLDAALERSDLSASALSRTQNGYYPELRLARGARLECLHGKHRIQAGREYLSPRDKWWIVDLYLVGESGFAFL